MATKVSATKKPADKSSKSKPSPKSAKPAAASYEFCLMAPDAAEVFLAGDFNNWESNQHKMRKFKNGLHKKSLKLKPGRYEYRFVVDGSWWTDPANEHRCANAYGEDNSVIEIS
jgi:1,4-alpha-glucan branching enzyme